MFLEGETGPGPVRTLAPPPHGTGGHASLEARVSVFFLEVSGQSGTLCIILESRRKFKGAGPPQQRVIFRVWAGLVGGVSGKDLTQDLQLCVCVYVCL